VPNHRDRAAVVLMMAALVSCARLRPATPARPVLVVAHRGASDAAPENTLAAYRAAMARGARAAECDVRLSADGAVVVIHDATLERTTNGSGPVAARTLADLRRLDAGGWKAPSFAGERIPELGEVLDLVRGRMILFVDLKDGSDLEERIARVVGDGTDVVAVAFDPRRIARIRRLLPHVPAMLLVRREPDAEVELLIAVASQAGAALLGVELAGIDRPLIETAHRAGLGVFAWTVNDPDEARALAAAGIDGLITDRPDAIAEAVRE
jgi:glycerophosphoryl diester phosphodiesterase